VNKLTGTAAVGVPVSLYWTKFVGTFPDDLIITTVNSKNDGSFDFTAHIDTTYFSQHYSLALRVNSNNEYFLLNYGVIYKQTSTFDLNAFQNIQFEVYKKANLKLRLHRTASDNFQLYEVSHSNVVDGDFRGDYYNDNYQAALPNPNEVNVETVADVYTKIKTSKTSANGTITETLDSVKCTSTVTSTVDINF
jgi:hypothetical protein